MQSVRLPGGSIRARSLRLEASFTISKADAYDYNILGGDHDPDDLHEELAQLSNELGQVMQSFPSASAKESLADEYLLDVLSKMIFGSNYIETTGGGLDVTLKICQAIFKDEDVPEIIDDGDPDYEMHKRDAMRNDKGIHPDTSCILRSRREIIQHARAASHILSEIYLHDKDLDEGIILETHRILTKGIDTEQGHSWTQYSGVYRQLPVAAGLHSFPPADLVPTRMRQMISSLNNDLVVAAKEGKIDPVALASKYCHEFVNTHPFLDGNGRTCRLILNVLLLKYGGLLVCIGQEDGTREEYLSIAARASENIASARDDWDEDDENSPKHYKELASFTLKHATSSLRKFIQTLKGDGRKGNEVSREA
ncbi:fido domain-containing protein [Lasiosphaeria hispida]|uniref:Fido domain-containing protein n=1 Tax=Lasiosphaeria hispida TaxID=260671 RepID=A0AAJ0HWA1_9PEZI|nr:fido domain-containing protein [Lasiosphaeria hispida]